MITPELVGAQWQCMKLAKNIFSNRQSLENERKIHELEEKEPRLSGALPYRFSFRQRSQIRYQRVVFLELY